MCVCSTAFMHSFIQVDYELESNGNEPADGWMDRRTQNSNVPMFVAERCFDSSVPIVTNKTTWTISAQHFLRIFFSFDSFSYCMCLWLVHFYLHFFLLRFACRFKTFVIQSSSLFYQSEHHTFNALISNFFSNTC